MNSRSLIMALSSTMVLAACDQPDDINRVVGEMASDRIELTAEVSEPIVEILVSEGEIVQQGQLLLRQDNSRALASTLEAKASLGQIDAGLRDFEAALKELPNNLELWTDYEFFLRAKGDLAGAEKARKEITRLSQ